MRDIDCKLWCWDHNSILTYVLPYMFFSFLGTKADSKGYNLRIYNYKVLRKLFMEISLFSFLPHLYVVFCFTLFLYYTISAGCTRGQSRQYPSCNWYSIKCCEIWPVSASALIFYFVLKICKFWPNIGLQRWFSVHLRIHKLQTLIPH